MTREVSQDTITEETGDVMQDSRQGEDNTTTSVDPSEAIVDPGSSGWEQDFDQLRAKISTQLKAWEDSQRTSITKQLESYKAQQELQILKSIQSETSDAQTRPDAQATELQKALDICRRERDELFKECQTLRSRERQLNDDLNETRLALTRQTLDLQADKVKLLEELNTAKSAPQLHQIKLLEELNAAKSAQFKLLEELSAARTALAGMTAGVNVVKMQSLEDDESDGSEIASDEEAYTEDTRSLEELRAQESGRTGSVDEGPPDVVVPRRLQVGVNEPFQERRRRWQTLTWTAQETYDIKGPYSTYELFGGMFIKTDEKGNVLILQLPTSRDPVYQVITQCKFTTKICGFALDASQDLLVVSSCDHQKGWIAMYSPTGSKREPVPHPEATKHRLEVQPWDQCLDGPQSNYILRIAGDHVGMLIRAPTRSRLLIWNWKIGTLIGGHRSFPDAYAFSFVSPTLFHVTTVDGSGSIVLYSIDPSNIAPTGFTHLASLLLPPLTNSAKIVSVECATEPLQAGGSDVFQLSVLQIKYATPFQVSEFRSFQLMVSTSVFIDYWNHSRGRTPNLPIIAQWGIWGPSKTRWIRRFERDPWTRHLRGQRVSVDPVRKGLIEVLNFDFDPNSPPKDLDPSAKQEICTKPAIIRARGTDLFCNDIVSTLPYIATTRVLALGDNVVGWVIDEERIIAVSAEGFVDQRISKLTTLTF
ncbi:hypothetical protein EST38_g6702 [Candolleomyces aberdarensis]|uniref:Uncharacterized protein n=1 Tax=Candolleomyces aberdarensis TaxID=2316362 RepID=A0A4V1Q3M9_9AGAR|nr:hypothetical protein EST38_g6702 [Candolleomyces aberdarensis]